MGTNICRDHPKAPVVAECSRCARPLCAGCTIMTPTGKFCSPECRLLHRSQKRPRGKKSESKGNAAKVVILLFLIVLLALVGIHTFGSNNPTLQKWDFVGKLVEAIRR